MKPKLIHQEAMNLSFRAKQALEEGNHIKAFDLYQKAAELESQVAEFYFDKPDLEPTRSVIIRSAAFLNLKAGLIEQSKAGTVAAKAVKPKVFLSQIPHQAIPTDNGGLDY